MRKFIRIKENRIKVDSILRYKAYTDPHYNLYYIEVEYGANTMTTEFGPTERSVWASVVNTLDEL